MKNRNLKQRISAVLMCAALAVNGVGHYGSHAETAYAQEEMTEAVSETGNDVPEETYDMIEQSVKPGITAVIAEGENINSNTEINEGSGDKKETETGNAAKTEEGIALSTDEEYGKYEGIEAGTETRTEESTEIRTEESTEIRTEESTETRTEESTETRTEKSSEESTEENTKACMETGTEKETEAGSEIDMETEKETETERREFRIYTKEDETFYVEFNHENGIYQPGETVSLKIVPVTGYAIVDVHAMITIESNAGREAGEGNSDVNNTTEQVFLTGEELSASVIDLDPAYSIVETGDESVVELAEGLSAAKTMEFEMPESDITILGTTEYAENEDIRSIRLNADASLGLAYGPSELKNSGTSLYIDKFEVTIKTADGDTETKNAYCLQPAISNPESGVYKEGTGNNSFQILDEDGSGKNALIARALFYLYGGPAWGKEIDGFNLKEILQTYGCNTKDEYYCMTHYVLSYLYDTSESNWNAWYDPNYGKRTGVFNDQGKACIKEIAAALKKMSAPVTRLSKTSITSSIGANGNSVSETVTYESFEENTATITLPSGVTLYTGGKGYTGSCKISGGTSFYLEKRCTAPQHDTITLTARYGTDFTAMKLKQSGRQDVAFAYYSGGEIKLDVEWTAAKTAIKITKQDAVTGSSSPINDNYSFAGAQYTIYSDSACTSAIETVTVPASGSVVTGENYSVGTYYVKETKAPACGLYELSGKVLSVTVTASQAQSGEAPAVTDIEQPRKIAVCVNKVDAETGLSKPYSKALTFEGAQYGLYKDSACTELLETITIGADGKGTGTMHFVSAYWVKEITAPEGYQPDRTIYEVSASALAENVKMGSVSYTVTSREQIIRGNVSFMKTLRKGNGDQITEGLEGIGFRFTYEADPGITFQVSDEEEINTIRTDKEGYATTASEEQYPQGTLIYGIWRVEEIDAPKGMAVKEPFTIMIDTHGRIYRYVVDNEMIASYLMIEKRDAQTGNLIPISGVTFRILDEENHTVSMFDKTSKGYADTWTTDNEGTIYLPECLDYGDYVLEETGGTPEGYDAIEPLSFSVREMNKNVLTPMIVTVYEEPSLIPISLKKQDAQTGVPLEKAVFDIYTAEDICDPIGEIRNMVNEKGEVILLKSGTFVTRITTDEYGNASSIPLYAGAYEIREAEAPTGYAITETPRQVVIKGIEQTSKDGGVFYDYQTQLRIRKVDEFSGEPLEGAAFLVNRVNGKSEEAVTIHSDSQGIAELKGFEKNTDYVIQEVETVPGHVVNTEEIRFSVDENGLINGSYLFTFTMPNGPVQAAFSKTDLTGTKEIEGASLTIRDSRGNLVETWISGNEPHIIRGILPGVYTLTEEIAPAGYVTAETITFTVENTGEIQHVQMKDDVTKLKISKKDITTGKPVIGAELIIRDSEGKLVERWTSEKDSYYIEMLPVGEYTLTEITAPEGYKIAETVSFEVRDTAKIQKVVMYDEPGSTVSVTGPQEETEQKTKSPATGDDTPVEALLLIAAASLMAVWILQTRKRHEKE